MIFLQGIWALTKQESWLVGILLAEPEERRQELCQRMWRLSCFKNCPPQALWKLTVLVCTDSPMEWTLDRLSDRFTAFCWLEGRQLQLDSRHSQPLDQDGILWACQGHQQRFGTSGSNYRRGCTTSRSPRLHHKWPGSDFYVQVLVLALLLPRHQVTALYHVPPSDRLANGTTEQHNGSIPSCFLELGAEWLGTALINSGVRIQQLQEY